MFIELDPLAVFLAPQRLLAPARSGELFPKAANLKQTDSDPTADRALIRTPVRNLKSRNGLQVQLLTCHYHSERDLPPMHQQFSGHL